MPPRTNKWIVWSFVLALNLGLFLIARAVLHKSALELAGPYLATFVTPVPIFVLVASWLRKWETRRPSPRLLALCWSLSVAILVAAVSGALFYYGAKFHLINPTVGDLVYVVTASVLSASFIMYHTVLPVIVARMGTFPP